MKLWLSRQRDGNYMLTRHAPQKCKMSSRAGLEDVYVRPGDPIQVKHLCSLAIEGLCGRSLEPLDSCVVDLTIRILDPLK